MNNRNHLSLQSVVIKHMKNIAKRDAYIALEKWSR